MAKILSFLFILAFVLVATAEECAIDMDGLVKECKQYVKFPAEPKIPPSNACCSVVMKVNIPCLCSKITNEVEKVLCMEKVVYVAGFCKNPLKPGSQCGSFKVPPLGQ